MANIDQATNFMFYTTSEGKENIQVYIDRDRETVWMTQKAMSEVFDCTTDNISLHLKNIFNDGELDSNSVTEDSSVTAADGKKYKVKIYNLDAIISVGYRVNSQNATRFRMWATSILTEYLKKGFVMDDDRLTQGNTLFGKDYFDELLERVQEIRRSERRFNDKVTDLYATSVDYDSKSPITKQFYATVQNKLEFAITKMTAAEILQSRANSDSKDMGLTTWKFQKTGGKILKTDVTVAKNYLTETEISNLNHLVSMYLDYAESQARKGTLMSMRDWADKLDAFLKFNEYDILIGAGKVKSSVAKAFAKNEYVVFRKIQDQNYISDYNRFSQTIDDINRTGFLPKENLSERKITTSSMFSIEDELAKERKKMGLKDNQELSAFNKSLKKGLDFNPKDED